MGCGRGGLGPTSDEDGAIYGGLQEVKIKSTPREGRRSGRSAAHPVVGSIQSMRSGMNMQCH